MAVLAQDDFSGSGALQSRNTSGNANHKWIRCQPSRGDITDLTISAGEVSASPLDTDLSDGYRLVYSDTGLPVLFAKPYSIDLVFVPATGLSGMSGVNAGASDESFLYDYQGSVFQVRNGTTRAGSGQAAMSDVSAPGSFSPAASVSDSPNTLHMSVGVDGFVTYKLNDTMYGSFDYYYPAPASQEIAIMVWGGHTLSSIIVYDGEDPPTPGTDPVYFWTNVKNCTQEPIT